MARLDTIATALTTAQTIAADEAAQVTAHLTRLGEQVTAMQATIDGLVADQVPQEEIDTLTAQAAALATNIEAIDSEGEGPIEEPPPVVA